MTAKARWACLLAGAALIALRAPVLVLEPRMWAEDASVYLAYAQSQSFPRGLLFVPTSEGPAGYLNLPANLAATLSAFVFPLEWAPVVGTGIAFLLQLAPLAVVLWGRSRFWNTPRRRVTACLLLLVAPAVLPEVWLSVISSQVFCGLTAALLLGEDLREAGRRRLFAYRLLLAFCGLSGAYASLLAPAFLLKARLEKLREAWVHFAILASTAALQAAAYAASLRFHFAPDRFDLPAWTAVPAVVALHQVLKPILSPAVISRLEPWIDFDSAAVGLACLAGVIAFAGWLAWRGDGHGRLFVAGFAVLAGATTFLAYGLPRDRYAVLPGLLLLLSLLVGGFQETGARRWVCRALVGVALASGAATYRHTTPDDVEPFGLGPGRPDWRDEVARWRRDPRHVLQVWPYGDGRAWPVRLTRRGDFRTLREALSGVEDFHLVAGAAERRIAIGGLPADFRMVVQGRGSLDARLVRLEMLLQDATGATLAAVPLGGFRAHEPFTIHFTASHLRPDDGRDLGATRFLTWRATGREGATGQAPGVVEVSRIAVVPRIEGLLDDFLPARALPRRLYHAPAERPPARDATPYLLVAAPFTAAAGPAGAVALNVLLFAAMIALAWRDRRAQGRTGRLFAVAFFVAAAGFGYVFLARPQVFTMFCLFVPARLWILGRLGEAGVGARALCGVLLAVGLIQLGFELPGAGKEDFATSAWRLYAARDGVVFGYPFVVLAVAWFVREAADRARLLLFAALAAWTLWIAWRSDASGPLGSPLFAAVFPLFVLLPRTVGRPAWLVPPAAVAVLVTWGVVSSVWTP